MSTNKYFTENWIVVFGIVLILVTYYKYETDPHIKNDNSSKKEASTSTEKKVSQNPTKSETERTPAADDSEDKPTLKKDTDTDAFDSSGRFNRAVTHRQQQAQAPAPNFANVAARQHHLLQNTSWKLWSNTRVVKTSEISEDNEVLARLNNLSVVSSYEDADLSQFDTLKQAVVFGERLKKPGIITGVIKVRTADKARLQEDLKNWQAEISDEFESIQTYFIRSQNKVFNLEALYENLKSQDYITEVELEVLNRGLNKN